MLNLPKLQSRRRHIDVLILVNVFSNKTRCTSIPNTVSLCKPSSFIRQHSVVYLILCIVRRTLLQPDVHLLLMMSLGVSIISITVVLSLLTYSMVQSPSWEANWFAAIQEIPRISRNPKVHYRTHKRPPTVRILGQPNSVHIPTSHLLEIHPNIIHSSTPRSPQWSISLRFPHQDPHIINSNGILF